ncbi:MAG TPA: nitroreductase family protein [Bacteroidales bacterium]|nr:nitroreductase family protein [Bacteroidales bacterium]HPT02996.1 nitroreductase family protein [Bacteroidales bacterium]
MEFYDVIRKRESTRNYDPMKPVGREILDRILEAGRIAPSAANYQPWHFYIVSSYSMLEKVRKCYDHPWLYDAPHILVVVGSRREAWQRPDGYNSLETDLAIAMTHMILAAENEGVSTCWIAHFGYPKLRAALELKNNEEVFAITPLGYPKEGYVKRGVKNRKPAEDIVSFI